MGAFRSVLMCESDGGEGSRQGGNVGFAQTTLNLKQLRDRIENSEEIVVDQHGTLRLPEDPAVANDPTIEKTKLKPSRWY